MNMNKVVGGILVALPLSASVVFAGHHEEGEMKEPNANAECHLTIEGSDAMQYNTREMSAPASCSEVTVTLVHAGNLPKEAMGDNWVLTASGDFNDVANLGMRAGLANNYIPDGDSRVIAGSEVIGGGGTTSVTFSTEGMTAGADYTYFCSFPGHWGMMKGAFKLV